MCCASALSARSRHKQYERSEMKVRMFINIIQVLENLASFDVMLCQRASSFDVFEESKHVIPSGPIV